MKNQAEEAETCGRSQDKFQEGGDPEAGIWREHL